jgi:hypothetical protein
MEIARKKVTVQLSFSICNEPIDEDGQKGLLMLGL